MADDLSFKDFLLDQLSDIEGLECKGMFSGHGLYGTALFGIIYKDRLYFKTNDETRAEYARLGMGPFSPTSRVTLREFYEVPADIVQDRAQLLEWALRAPGSGS